MSTIVQETVTTFYYPNKMGRIILIAIEEVMGRNGVNAVLNLAGLKHLINNYPPNNFDRAFSFEEVSALLKALEDLYGPRGGRALAVRAGRAVFKFGLKDFGPILGIADLAFRIMPLNMKMKVGFEVFAELFNKFTDQIVRLGEDEKAYYWIIERCPMCWGRKSEGPVGSLATGILQEGLYWLTGGKNFHVEETECVACSAHQGLFVIDKRPLD
ncbi:MAG TPA: 4-vinyl reductase [Anaerolineae bacterium]|nr:4-vinyl reductase [Anaerolineae bacterium]